VATGIQVPSETLDSRAASKHQLRLAAAATLANATTITGRFTQEHFDKGNATEKAIKTQREVRLRQPGAAGRPLRCALTDRDATTQNSNPNYNWSPISQTWQGLTSLAYLGDPRFSGNTQVVKSRLHGRQGLRAVAGHAGRFVGHRLPEQLRDAARLHERTLR